MKKTRPLALTALSTLLAWSALVGLQTAKADAAALAQKKGCMACHAVDKKIVGPSYKEVAAKYKGDDKAVAFLSEKVIKGGSGVWGTIPMPANASVKKEEATALVEWILQQ